MRRGVRWLVRTGLALGALATLALGTVVGLVYTDCGRDRIARIAEEQLETSILGEVSIGALAIGLGGRLGVERLEVRDQLAIGSASIDCSVRALLRGELRCSRLEIVAPVIYLTETADGPLELALQLAPGDSEAPPPTISIDQLSVRDGQVVVRRLDGSEERVTAVAFSGSFAMARDVMTAELARLEARWRDVALTVAGVRLADQKLAVADAAARFRGSELHVPSAEVALGKGAIAAALTARVLPADAVALVPAAAPLRAEVDLAATARRDAGDAPWQLELSAAAAGGELGVKATVLPARSRVQLALTARELRPAAVWATAPEGALEAELALTAEGADRDALTGELAGRVAGELAGAPRFTARLEARVADGRASAEVDLETRRGGGAIVAAARRDGDTWRLERGAIDATLPDLRGVTAGLVAGSAKVQVQARGDMNTLDVDAELEGASLRADGLAIAAIDLDATVRGLRPRDPLEGLGGSFRAGLRGLNASGVALSRAAVSGSVQDAGRRAELEIELGRSQYAERVAARVTVARRAGRTVIAIPRASAEIGGQRWSMVADAIERDAAGRLAVRGGSLASNAGQLRIAGDLDGRRRRSAAERLEVTLELDLAAARPTLRALAGGSVPALAGRVELTAALGRSGRELDVNAALRGRRIAWRPKAGAIDVDLDAALASDGLSARAELRDTGSAAVVGLGLELAMPSQMTDGAAWAQLGRDDLRSASLAVKGLSAAAVEQLAAIALPVRGALDASVTWPDGGARRARIEARAYEVAVAGYDDLGAELELTWDDARLAGKAVVKQLGRDLFKSTLGAEVGMRDVLARGAAIAARAPISAEVTFESFGLSRLVHAKLVEQQLSGRLSARVLVSGTVREPRVVVRDGRVVSARFAGVLFRTLEFEGEASREQIVAAVHAEQSRGGTIGLSGRVALADQGMSARLVAERFDLTALRAFATDDASPLAAASGLLSADVALAGNPRDPRAEGTLRVTGAQLLAEGGARRLQDGELEVRFQGTRIAVERFRVASGVGGSISGAGFVDVKGLTPTAIELRAELSEFPYLAGANALEVDATAELRAALRDDALAGTLTLERGRVQLSSQGAELQPIGELEDVVYVDQLEREAERAEAGPTPLPRLDLTIATPRPLRVKSKELDAQVKVDLHVVVGAGGLERLSGDVEILDSSSVVVYERRYQFERGLVVFGPPNFLDPRLDVRVSRAFPAATIAVEVTGTARKPTIELRSDAGYDEWQVLTIMLGQDPSDTQVSGGDTSEGAAQNAFNVIAAQLKDRIGVPVDVVKKHADGVEIGKWFTRNLLIGYRVRTTGAPDENANEVTVEYRMRRDLMFQGRYGAEDGSAELLWLLRW